MYVNYVNETPPRSRVQVVELGTHGTHKLINVYVFKALYHVYVIMVIRV